jgi:hypothetical protein
LITNSKYPLIMWNEDKNTDKRVHFHWKEFKKMVFYAISFISPALYILIFWLKDLNVFFAVFLIVVILMHELGHFYSMRMYNFQNCRIYFVLPWGALCTGEKDYYILSQRLIINMAGPLPGLFIGIILNQVSYYNNLEDSYLKLFSDILVYVNALNLMPVYPLDGYWFLVLLINPNKKWEKIILLFSLVLSLCYILVTGLYFFVIIPVFQIYAIIRLKKYNEDNDKIIEREEFEKISNKGSLKEGTGKVNSEFSITVNDLSKSVRYLMILVFLILIILLASTF